MAEMPPIKLEAEIILKDTHHLEMFLEFTEVTEPEKETPKRYWRTVSFNSEPMYKLLMELRLGHKATVEIEAGDEGEIYKLYFEQLSFLMWLSEFQLREGHLEQEH